jgi:hypothetical protein
MTSFRYAAYCIQKNRGCKVYFERCARAVTVKLIRGNAIDLAVAVVMEVAFGADAHAPS